MTPEAGTTLRQHLEFGPLTIAFDDRVLRPRPWTTAQSAWAADLLGRAAPGPVLELCCGAGQIGLLAVHGSDRRLVCVDANPDACAFTAENAAVAGMADRVEVRHGDLATALRADERFVLVLADPPWVPAAETSRYPEDPLLAIDGGDDGLAVAVTCLEVAARHLVPGGSVLLQLGTSAQVEVVDEAVAAPLGLTPAGTRVFDRGVVARFVAGRPRGL